MISSLKIKRLAVPALLAFTYSMYAVVNTRYHDKEFERAIFAAKVHFKNPRDYVSGNIDQPQEYWRNSVQVALISHSVRGQFSAYAACLKGLTPMLFPAWYALKQCSPLHPSSFMWDPNSYVNQAPHEDS